MCNMVEIDKQECIVEKPVTLTVLDKYLDRFTCLQIQAFGINSLSLYRHPTLVAMSLALMRGERERNLIGFVVFTIHIMVVFCC